jgi:hypothetical protein
MSPPAASDALERLAQDNPAHRQTIVNAISAYLRMPFSPTAPARKPEPEATEEGLGQPAAETETRTVALGDTWQQERQVRLTAQRILAEHLRDDRAKDQHSADPPSARFWPGIRLDLVGATLIDFNLRRGVMADASFRGATFSGTARFDRATFTGGGDGMSFERSRVLSPGAQHVWPTGWCLGPDDSSGHTVVRANGDGRS